MTASAVVLATGIGIRNLSQAMIDVYVVRTMSCVSERLNVFSGELVSSQDRF